MASSPRWKVYDACKQYRAACHEIEAAAVLVSFYGDGSTIRSNHKRTVWTEGVDGTASDSYDAVAAHTFAQIKAELESLR